jgi:hypothetical protein
MEIGNWKPEIRKSKLENGNSKMGVAAFLPFAFSPLSFDLLSAEALSCAVLPVLAIAKWKPENGGCCIFALCPLPFVF